MRIGLVTNLRSSRLAGGKQAFLRVLPADHESSSEMALEDLEAREDAHSDLREPSQFERFFNSEWNRLSAYLSRFVARTEAEEIAQEAFVRVYTCKGEVRSPTGLLYHTARNLLSNSRRNRATAAKVLVESTDIALVPDATASPEDQVEQRDRLERAAKMVEGMPAKVREVFLLQVIEGYSYAEISGQMGISVVSVKKKLMRAFEICAAAAEAGERQSGRRNQRRRRTPRSKKGA